MTRQITPTLRFEGTDVEDDDEQLSPSERTSIERAWADIREGRTYSTDELLARLGLVPNAPVRPDSEE
jgi:hypothetical protein